MYRFALARNIWGFLAASHAPITANGDLSNKLYFCLGLLSNLAYIMIPVDARSIILGIFYPFHPSLYGIILGTFDDCWVKQTFWRIWCVLNFLGNWVFDRFRDWRSLSDQTFWCDSWNMSWSFYGIFINIWSEPSILEVNILLWTTLWDALHKIFPIWGYFAFPHEWNFGKFIIKHHMKLRWDVEKTQMRSAKQYNQSLD